MVIKGRIVPKTYSDIEKNNIRKSLRREGAKCLSIYGVKKTTVDELVKRTGIPKGTFYLFYSSKEALFFDIITGFADESENLYLEMLQNLDENHIVTSLTDVFMAIAMKFYNDGIYRILDDRELELIIRPIEDGKVKELREKQKNMFRNLFSYFSIDDEDDIASFCSGFEASLYIFLHSDRLEDIEKALRVIIRGLVLQMVE